MLPVGKGKNYSRFHEFRQIICPLTKHRQNKQNFGKIFKIQVFALISITMIFPVIVIIKLTEDHEIKGNNSFQLQHFFDKHMVSSCKSVEH